MAIHPAALLGIVAGGVYLASGIVILLLKPARRGMAAFAAFSILAGAQQILLNVGAFVLNEPSVTGMSWPVMGLAGVALVHAVDQYLGKRGALPVAFLALAAAGVILVIARPGWMLYAPDGGLEALGAILWQAPFFAASVVSATLLLQARIKSMGRELRNENLLLLLSIVPFLGYTSSVTLVNTVRTPGVFEETWAYAFVAVFGAGIVVACATAASLWREDDRMAKGLGVLVLLATAIGLVQSALTTQLVYFGGALRILAAVMLAYGLLKYGLFDVDLKLKWSLDRGALLAIFGGVFFLVDQAAQFFVSTAFGALAGIIAAVALLVLLKPLRKATQKLADRVFPHVHDTQDYFQARKLVVYRSAAEAAAKDGVITDRERDMLATLVRELEIPDADVLTIEREVLRGAQAA